jgi:RHS repeat-associated protein
MSVYEHKVDNTAQTLTYTQQEKHIYGSSRVGMDVAEKDMITPTITEQSFYRESGKKQYELSNHLGNVLTVITDKKLPVESTTTTGTVDYFVVEILSASDYSPFGVLLQNREFASAKYRFGFNGQEKDDEVAGSGNSYTAEYWQYDPRLGRRWNIDPIMKGDESPYATFANSPIYYADPNGLLAWHPEDDGTGTGNQVLVADEGDLDENGVIIESKLHDYLDEIGVGYTEAEFRGWVDNAISTPDRGTDATNTVLTSDQGKFNNLVGTYLVTKSMCDPTWGYYNPSGGWGCSPTLANRSAEAVKFVYGENSAEYQKLDRNNQWAGYIGYHLFQNNYVSDERANNTKYGPNGIAGYGVTSEMRNHSVAGALEYSGTGYYVSDAWNGGLKPGAALGLGYHTAIFINYTFDKDGNVNGLYYWDDHNTINYVQKGVGSPQPRIGGNWK